MYKSNGNTFFSFKDAVEYAREANSVVIEVGTHKQVWSPKLEARLKKAQEANKSNK
jgi:hypothetical protein